MSTLTTVLTRLASPPVQTLHTLQPTSSTVTYTVSTRPIAKGLPARLAFYIGICIKALLGVCVTVTLWTKWRARSGEDTWLLPWIIGTAKEQWFIRGVDRMESIYLIPTTLVVLYLAFKRSYRAEESLTVLRGLGLQTSTMSSLYLRTPTTRFIPTTSIQDIFIHEAFKGFEVKYYLAVVVKGEQDVVVVFPKLMPRRAILEEVWRGARRCLFEGTGVKVKAKQNGAEEA
ncbi:hypothetical protein CC80DRAFT_575100 [Byssothecium circinans]|uniref:Phosphatidylinositol N-acetylglucosaminyltransferase subunit H conserved domain-containing protein n=1 Tax=Byssothecium circinans TaxID=147558 RepID=A0A6A5THG6_9PLEO|nr:hypothetical protein CC80DRAFT_575100 [Byssothecium circinans]